MDCSGCILFASITCSRLLIDKSGVSVLLLRSSEGMLFEFEKLKLFVHADIGEIKKTILMRQVNINLPKLIIGFFVIVGITSLPGI